MTSSTAAAKFASFSDSQFEDWCKNNPGSRTRASQMRSEYVRAHSSKTESKPQPQPKQEPVEVYEEVYDEDEEFEFDLRSKCILLVHGIFSWTLFHIGFLFRTTLRLLSNNFILCMILALCVNAYAGSQSRKPQPVTSAPAVKMNTQRETNPPLVETPVTTYKDPCAQWRAMYPDLAANVKPGQACYGG